MLPALHTSDRTRIDRHTVGRVECLLTSCTSTRLYLYLYLYLYFLKICTSTVQQVSFPLYSYCRFLPIGWWCEPRNFTQLISSHAITSSHPLTEFLKRASYNFILQCHQYHSNDDDSNRSSFITSRFYSSGKSSAADIDLSWQTAGGNLSCSQITFPTRKLQTQADTNNHQLINTWHLRSSSLLSNHHPNTQQLKVAT